MSDAALLAHLGAQIGSVAVSSAIPRTTFVRRNTGIFGRLPLPGHRKYKPTVETSFENAYLAGDWVRNSLEIPSMEGAMRAGVAAALRALGKFSK